MLRRLVLGCAAALLVSGATTGEETPQTDVRTVRPVVETEPVPNRGDAADDPAIWVHPVHSELSLVIGTDKGGGLATYDLDGALVQYIEMTKPNNVDLRYGFPLGERSVDIVTVSERGDDSIVVFAIDPDTRMLARVPSAPIRVGFGIYGLCMYHSAASGRYYAFANAKSGEMGQWELQDDGEGGISGRLVRSFHVGTQVEGCVADDELGWLYIGEESVALWKYPAEPGRIRTRRSPTDQWWICPARAAPSFRTSRVWRYTLVQTAKATSSPRVRAIARSPPIVARETTPMSAASASGQATTSTP